MKYFITLLIAALSLNAFGQSFPPLPYNPDQNGDGLIGASDLQDLLAVYGLVFEPFALSISETNESALISLGIRNRLDCERDCSSLPGPWSVMTVSSYAVHHDLVHSILAPTDEAWIEPLIGGNGSQDFISQYITGEGAIGNASYLYIDDTIAGDDDYCFCSVTQIPKVEFHQISDSEFDDLKEELSNEGWRLQSSNAGKVYFWRWAVE